jgi:hypothetical protein
MTFAKFDQRSLILDILRRFDISIAAFSRLQFETHLNRWTVERLLNGDRLDQTETAKLYRLAKCIEDLQAHFPVPLNWDESDSIRRALAQDYRGANTPAQSFVPTARA